MHTKADALSAESHLMPQLLHPAVLLREGVETELWFFTVVCPPLGPTEKPGLESASPVLAEQLLLGLSISLLQKQKHKKNVDGCPEGKDRNCSPSDLLPGEELGVLVNLHLNGNK